MKIKDVILSAVSGILLALSFPNFIDIGFSGWTGYLAWFALVPLFIAVKNKNFFKSFLYGLVTGLFFFGCSVYWVILVKEMGWLSIPAWFGISFYLALFVAFFAMALSFTNLVMAPFLWVGFEFLRATLFTGFPWIMLGYSQYKNTELIQVAAFAGVYGVSFIVVFINMAIADMLIKITKGRNAFTNIIIGVIMYAACFGYGALIITNYSTEEGMEERLKKFGMENYNGGVYQHKPSRKIKVSVTQGNIAQDKKWDEQFTENTFKIYEGLTKKALLDKPNLIVWPETASTVYLRYDNKYYTRVNALIKNSSTDLLVGTPDADLDKDKKVKNYYNSVFYMNSRGLVDKYDKIHLVPFGEYMPMEKYFTFLQKLTGGFPGYTAGQTYKVFKTPYEPFSAMICYEIIFPGNCREFARNGAGFIANVTNDAWYRESAASYQHFLSLVFRAVENRVNIARAANTGVSGFVDYKGEIIGVIDIFKEGKLTAVLTLPEKKFTFYTLYGDWFLGIAIALGIAGTIFIRRANL